MLQKAKPKRKSLIDIGQEYTKMLLNKLSRLLIDTKYSRVGKALARTIPVLSIFALLGMSTMLLDPFHNVALSAYAANDDVAPLSDTGASLVIDEGKIKDTILAGAGEFVYATHKVAVEATNIKSYSLTLSGPTTITANGTTLAGAGNGTAADSLNNQWGYAWIAENADPKTATYKSVASNVSLGDLTFKDYNLSDTKQLAFGAKFNSNAGNGHYTANVTLSLVATPRVVTNWKVTYNCNSGTGCPTNLNTSSDADSYSYTIPSTAPTRSGYKFLGYGTGSTAETAYAAGKTITLTTANPTLSLNAIWQQDIQGLKTITQMQQMTSAVCTASADGDTNTLTDTRDNATYTVKKIGSKCWMTQNLRLAGGSSVKTTDSNVTSNYTLPAATSGNFSSTNTTQQMRNAANNTYGAYYSWCAATAGTCGSYTTDGAEATQDICPKGWQLPSGKPGTGTNDFAVALGLGSVNITRDSNFWSSLPSASRSITNNALAANGTSWAAAGYVNTSGILNAGSEGDYWSRTANGTTSAYDLYFSNGNLEPANSISRSNGFSVRCVAK